MRGLLLAGCVFSLMTVGCQESSGASSTKAVVHPPVLPVISPPVDESGPRFRTLVIGDWGTGRQSQMKVRDAIVAWHRERPFDFAVTTGDNFYPAGVGSVDDVYFKERFHDVYGALEIDFAPALGNHDHYGNAEAQIERSAVDPRWILPSRFHRFTRTVGEKTILFIIVDTETFRKGGDDVQRAFIDAALNEPADFHVVIGHHPIFGHSVYGTDSVLVDGLLPLLRDRAFLYAAGHEHTLEVTGPRNGVVHVVSGGGGGDEMGRKIMSTDHDTLAMSGGGFVELTFSERGCAVTLVDSEGRARGTVFAATPAKRSDSAAP